MSVIFNLVWYGTYFLDFFLVPYENNDIIVRFNDYTENDVIDSNLNLKCIYVKQNYHNIFSNSKRTKNMSIPGWKNNK